MREKNIVVNNVKTNYIINENGEIKNLKTNKYLKGSISRAGYKYYRLSINGEKVRFYGHVLVATTFIGEIKEGLIVNRIDGDKLNNNINNLEIITKSENVKHAHDNGLINKKHIKTKEIEDLPNEEWLPIEGFDKYFISNKGRVKSCKRKKSIESQPSLVNGYYQISLSKNGNIKHFLIHQLVYMTFTKDSFLKGYVIDHIDNNPLNNNITNLRKLSYQQNTQVAYTEQKSFKKMRNVLAYKNDILIGKYYSCSEAARVLNLDASSVSKVCRGIYSHTHEYFFKYEE